MGVRLKTQPQIADALASKVNWHKRRGKPYRPFIPPLLHPRQYERAYERILMKSLTKLINFQNETLGAALPALIAEGRRELDPQRFDTFDDELTAIIDALSVEYFRELSQTEVKRIALLQGIGVSDFNRMQNNKVFQRVLGVDVFNSEPWLEAALNNFASENAALISTLSQRHVNEVRGIVARGVREGLTAEAVREQIRARVGKTTANLKLIARDQVSKLNGKLTELRQREVGIERYTWRTAMDERVRGRPGGRYPTATPSHWDKEGEVYSWDDPPADTGHPGADYQCRCYAEPILEDLV